MIVRNQKSHEGSIEGSGHGRAPASGSGARDMGRAMSKITPTARCGWFRRFGGGQPVGARVGADVVRQEHQ